MAVSYTNNWNNILNKLISIIRVEFTIPVIKGKSSSSASSYIRVAPLGSSKVELASHSEQREFNIAVHYVTQRRDEEDTFLEHITVQVSKLEALIHENITMTLADSTIAFNCHFASQEFDIEQEDEEDNYIIEWSFQCNHIGNTA